MSLSPARKKLLILAIAFQVISVAVIALAREIILVTGSPVTLQTAPIDPRDLFRGDYVRLDYLFNKVPVQLLSQQVKNEGIHKGSVVYLKLKQAPGGVYHAEKLALQKPDGLYLKGHTSVDWPSSYYLKNPEKASADEYTRSQPLQVKYGIERYYVEQGKGKAIEKRRGLGVNRNTNFQTPMLVHARLSSSGEAVISDYSWSNLGFLTKIAKSPERDAPDEQASAIMQFSIKNLSDTPLQIPLKPGNCSFDLITSGYDFDPQKQLQTGRDECIDTQASLTRLDPQQSMDFEFNLNNPAWIFKNNKKMQPLGRLPWNYRLRIVYNGDSFDGQQGQIISRAFHARGNVD